jgi:hypothetical protein
MKAKLFALALAVLVSSLTLCAAEDDVRITDLRTEPSVVYEDTEFDVYVRAVDHDGVKEIKLYIDGDLEDTEDCDDDDVCSVRFSVELDDVDTYEIRAKAWASGNTTDTDTEEIDVYVRQKESQVPYVSASVSPVQPMTGNAFTISAIASGVNPLYKIELRHGGSIIGTQYCGYTTYCSRSFAVSPKYTAGSYGFELRAYDEGDYVGSSTITVTVGQSNYCGDGRCSNGETCSSCSSDCGSCQPVYRCGDGVCNGGETCSSCSSDCGSCQQRELPVIVYTCDQRGGECCDNGGQGVVSGAADCPATCFSKCNAVTPAPATPSRTPSGAVVAVDSSTVLVGMLALMLLLVLYIAVKVR